MGLIKNRTKEAGLIETSRNSWGGSNKTRKKITMSDKHWVDEDHYRTVSEDGHTSYLFKADGGAFFPDTCQEVAEHHSDGTTQAYEPDNSVLGDGKGDPK